MADGGQITEYSGPLQWIVSIGVAVGTGLATVLRVTGRVAALETRVAALEESQKRDLGARDALKDEILDKLRESLAEFRVEVSARAADSVSFPGLTGMVESKVTAAIATANEKHNDRLMLLSDRISSLTGELRGIVTGGGNRR
jgi:hypothetical protein